MNKPIFEEDAPYGFCSFCGQERTGEDHSDAACNECAGNICAGITKTFCCHCGDDIRLDNTRYAGVCDKCAEIIDEECKIKRENRNKGVKNHA